MPQRSATYEAAERFVTWLEHRILVKGRGDDDEILEIEPRGKFWFGRLAPEEAVIELGWGDRGERLDPCAIGVRIRPQGMGPWHLEVACTACAWLKSGDGWRKTSQSNTLIEIEISPSKGEQVFGGKDIVENFDRDFGVSGYGAEIRAEVQRGRNASPEITLFFVNTTPKRSDDLDDTNLYQTGFSATMDGIEPFLLESLPDSFRYDRRVAAYGINCGASLADDSSISTSDTATVDRNRPVYWSVDKAQPDFSFEMLSSNPLPSLEQLHEHLRHWGKEHWTKSALVARGEREGWSDDMVGLAVEESKSFFDEVGRVAEGIRLLQKDKILAQAFCLMNRAMGIASNGRYPGWRPFQIGFLLANLGSITKHDEECETADIVWFATGGGKTETYLGLIVVTALYDRLTGKKSGITAWSRFPLRMLSLDQTQRFANTLAGAEIVRREAGIDGAPFSVGFLVGQGATPNSISTDPPPGKPDPDDEGMPAEYQVLQECPFCRQESIKMAFNRREWKLEHQCENDDCRWPEAGLPFYIVDDEIYRFLPTALVGTLDKAASIAIQASMRGLIAAPLGVCSREGHGFVYAARSKRPSGCLVPGCEAEVLPLPFAPERFPPSLRLQDELHLLRDSLGAVDSHYEALCDDLQTELCGTKPKILASSATLSGYEKQTRVLYRRDARVFPVPGPAPGVGFWSTESEELMRKFVGVAPRGITLEYTVDRLLTELQLAIRYLVNEPEKAATEIGIDISQVDEIVSLYGTNVVYGNTIRDLDAIIRSAETQVQVEGALNTASLTGRTDFREVRQTLKRLKEPEERFSERIHVVAASSMMSHGVDIDRLNVMVMLGIPLTTAEFIQATARVGRAMPAIVFVVHKIGRERDAGVFRSFGKFVAQGDRFVEPIPITSRSRRVLEKTIAGLVLARILAVHEPRAGMPLTTIRALQRYARSGAYVAAEEVNALKRMLRLEVATDEALLADLELWLERFFRNLEDPSGELRFPSELSPTRPPMLSLRDVEEQAPVYGSYD